MQAITTKYLPPSNCKPSRIAASCQAGRLVFSYDHEFDSHGNHVEACKALKARLGWDTEHGYTETVCGEITPGTCAHVFIPRD